MGTGKWSRALVTGASSGIGKAFAEALARQGTDLVVVARDEARLGELAARLEHDAGVGVEVIGADLTVVEDLARVAARTAAGTDPCDLVVNNAGLGVSGSFVDAGHEAAMAQVDLNVRALVRLTHAALSRMRTSGEGGILNVSSTAGFFPSPGGAVYSASKAFVINFGLGVAEELRMQDSAVRICTLCPGFTRTEFQARGGFVTDGIPGFLWHDADIVVREALTALGTGRTLCVPGVHNRVGAMAAQAVPRTVQARLIAGMSRGFRA
ncbi:MAG: SDR family oxidoreductase [Acidimicrobiia bacterium]|nr:SDR family oxidoreductase [Acidimicrobiia bacterium]